MQMYPKHLLKCFIQPTSCFQSQTESPFALLVIQLKWVGQTVVQTARTAVAKAEGEDFKWGDRSRNETSEELEVEEGTPVC